MKRTETTCDRCGIVTSDYKEIRVTDYSEHDVKGNWSRLLCKSCRSVWYLMTGEWLYEIVPADDRRRKYPGGDMR